MLASAVQFDLKRAACHQWNCDKRQVSVTTKMFGEKCLPKIKDSRCLLISLYSTRRTCSTLTAAYVTNNSLFDFKSATEWLGVVLLANIIVIPSNGIFNWLGVAYEPFSNPNNQFKWINDSSSLIFPSEQPICLLRYRTTENFSIWLCKLIVLANKLRRSPGAFVFCESFSNEIHFGKNWLNGKLKHLELAMNWRRHQSKVNQIPWMLSVHPVEPNRWAVVYFELIAIPSHSLWQNNNQQSKIM